MTTVALPLAIGLFALQTLALRGVKAASLRDKLLVNSGFCALCALVLVLLRLALPEAMRTSPATLLWGLAFGLLFALTILLYNLALASGPLAFTAFYFSASMVVPALFGILVMGEAVGTVPLALGLFLAAFALLNLPGGKDGRKPQRRWALLCLGCFVGNGLLAVVQKSHQAQLGGGEAGGLMLAGFATAALLYLLLYLLLPGAKGRPVEVLRQNAAPLPLLALGSLGGNLLLTWLAGRVPAGTLFPLVQGGVVVAVTLVSVLFFHERLRPAGWAGIALGVAAIVVINL